MSDRRFVDVAIIGAGAAGLSAALSLSGDCRVAIFAKRPPGDAASAWAQGGIAAVVGDTDTVQSHVDDTIQAGAGLCRAEAVREIVAHSPQSIEWLLAQGVRFDRGDDDKFSLGLEGGHQKRRIVHVGDQSGHAVLSALIKQVYQRPNITIDAHYIVIDLIVVDNRCCGFYVLNREHNRVDTIVAGAVILASGGAGRVYLYSSTPEDASGDGIAMAFRAGCCISNMEFIQFHPTCLYHPQAPTLLISEAIRGEGGRLVNEAGEYFATAAHPAGELAARDIVARAIDAEMKKTGSDCVYLDCQTQDKSFWQRRFPTIVEQCSARGINIPEDYLPVVPAAHYCCGGVSTNLSGETDLPGLYAIGEVACTGLHGANRLASNSLLECIVMGRRVAATIDCSTSRASIAAWDEARIQPAKEMVMLAHNWEELRRIMWNYVGIVRSDERLQRARRRIEWIQEEIDEFYRFHTITADLLELRNLAQCAELIIESALARRESRGLHFNVDCPQLKMTAVETSLYRRDFDYRRHAINHHCPFSGRLIVASATTVYRHHRIGFCNADCRDHFTQAAAQGFQSASADLLEAKCFFDRLVDQQREI